MDNKRDPAPGLSRQRTIYLGGMAGRRPIIPMHYDLLEEAARSCLPARAYKYIAAGAGDGKAVVANSRAFQQFTYVPRMLRDVERASLATKFCGVPLSSPVILSPVGVLELAHPAADLAVAKAAEQVHVPMIFSNQASVPMEQTASRLTDTPYWFQLYWSRSRDLVRSFVERAEACGSRGIVVTLDTTMLGWRPMDLESAYLPFLHGKGLAQYLTDPVFRKMVLSDTQDENAPKTPISLTAIVNALGLFLRFPGSTLGHLRNGYPLKAVRLFTRIYTNPGLNWQDLAFLKEITGLPVVLKGILSDEDAKKAVDHGIDGLIVSNHGGRQVEGAVPPLLQLPAIRKAVGPDFPIALDSGVRTGADILKAIRLGADAVCIGRPYVYALALGGQQGVKEYLENLKADLDLTMRLSGCRDLADVRKLEIKTLYGPGFHSESPGRG